MEFQGVRFSASAVSTTKRVTTFRSSTGANVTQHHHGYYGLVRMVGVDRNGVKCGHFHQKSRAATQCAERTARALIREQQKQEA